MYGQKFILGIGDDCFDQNIAIIDTNGEIKCAIAEERFSRIKKHNYMLDRFPHEMFEFALKYGGGIDFVTRAGIKDFKKKLNRKFFFTGEGFIYILKTQKKYTFNNLFKKRCDYANYLQKNGLQIDKYIEHHNCHLASAYFTSGFKNSIVFTLDATGDYNSGSLSCCKGSEIETVKRFYYRDVPIGYNYLTITALLGFRPNMDEGKIMSLASYGKYNQRCIDIIEKIFNKFKNKDFNFLKKIYNTIFLNQLVLTEGKKGWNRLIKLRKTIFKGFSKENIAFAVQYITEREVIKILEYYQGNSQNKNIVLAGGVFSNVTLNKKIKELGFKNIFIHPAMGDDGIGLGSALFYLNEIKGLKPFKLKNVYLGPEYSSKEVRLQLDKYKLNFEQIKDIELQTAELLAKGKTIARFNGRMEYGPRALGNRSILCQATDYSVIGSLNKKLNRENYMPFAPTTLVKYAAKCYKSINGAEYTAKFMTISFECKDWMKQNCPGAVHVDGTARPQMLDKKDNPGFYKTLDEYKKITGIPSIINTSFNIHGEPIVCTPEDAIKSFRFAKLDYLVIGDYMVKNNSF
ncbi:MAG: carbamoyltransferase C-terminal domain-containing protein [Nanoarchaeota archaeon]